MNSRNLLGFFAITALAMAGCQVQVSGTGSTPTSGIESAKTPLNVVCTTGMIADIVRNVGGDAVAVDQLLGADVDPHLYKPTPDDIRRLRAAKLIIYSGLHLEGKMTEVFEGLAKRIPVVSVGDGLPKGELLKDEEGHVDPHIWLDVRLWNEATSVVYEALALQDPSKQAYFQSNRDRYQKTLTDLHAEVAEKLKAVPKDRRVLITTHDAFQYFGRAYDVEVRGIQGISTETEASVRDIQSLVDFIAARKVKAVFAESSVNPRNMRSLIEGCAQKGHVVVQGGELYSDALGAPEGQAGTYVGMIRHNVDTLVKALR